MKVQLQNSVFDRLYFLGYHITVLFLTLFMLNYFSQSSPTIFSTLVKMTSGKAPKNLKGVLKERPLTLNMIYGEVKVFEDQFSGSERNAIEGEVLPEGAAIETRNGSVTLSFGNGYLCTLKLLPNTKLRIDELMAPKLDGEEKTEVTLWHLFKGQLIAELQSESTIIAIDFKTKGARFSLRPSVSGVAVDERGDVLLAVKAGEVRAENIKTLKFDMIKAPQIYFIDDRGRERKIQNSEVVNLFNWKISKDMISVIDFEKVLSLTGGAFIEPVAPVKKGGFSEEERAQLLNETREEMRTFRAYSSRLREDILSGKQNLEVFHKKNEKDAIKIRADINCLETSKRCDLYSEQLLLNRGFPRIHNSPRLVEGIKNDLRKYLNEQDTKLDEVAKEIEVLEALEKKRAVVFQWAEKQAESDSELRETLKQLRDQNLFR